MPSEDGVYKDLPSFFGHLFDYCFKQGGGYFGAKKALTPLTVVFDSYAKGDRDKANVYLVNQTPAEKEKLTVTATLYDLDGQVRHEASATVAKVPAATVAFTLARYTDMGQAYFVRLRSADGASLGENSYWQSATDDVPDRKPVSDMMEGMKLRQTAWADFTSLAAMPKVSLAISLREVKSDGDQRRFAVSLTNTSDHIAFFVRAELQNAERGEEILPIIYDDNYVTIYPNETKTIEATVDRSQLPDGALAVKVEGYNAPPTTARLGDAK